MKLDLHIHTDHSFDCRSKVADVVRASEMAGLDAIAITDHDNMSAYGLARKAAKTIKIIPATEITSNQGTHIIGLFLTNEIISRDCEDILDEIHTQGGLALVPHPFHKSTGFLSNRFHDKFYDGDEFEKLMTQIDLFEAYTYGAESEDIIDTNKFLSVHPDMPVCAGSDAHMIEDIGKAYTDLENVKSDDLDDIKKALLQSPRLLRYEAYSHDEHKLVQGEKHYQGKESFFKKLTNSTFKPMVNSIRNLYNRQTKDDERNQ